MRAMFGANRRNMLQRLRNERSSVTFVGGFSPLMASLVRETITNLLGRMTWPWLSIVLARKMHFFKFRVTLAFLNSFNA